MGFHSSHGHRNYTVSGTLMCTVKSPRIKVLGGFRTTVETNPSTHTEGDCWAAGWAICKTEFLSCLTLQAPVIGSSKHDDLWEEHLTKENKIVSPKLQGKQQIRELFFHLKWKQKSHPVAIRTGSTSKQNLLSSHFLQSWLVTQLTVKIYSLIILPCALGDKIFDLSNTQQVTGEQAWLFWSVLH